MTNVTPLGPGTIFWRLTGDWRTMLLAGRALVMQTAYPAVGAGVGEHSVYKTDPYGRLDRTMRSVMAQVYGGEQAVEEGRRLREMHRDIKGVDAKGRRYSALNPDAYLWVHATAFAGFLVFLERFDRPASEAETQQLFDEWRRLGLVLGIPDRRLPRTVTEFWQTWDRLVANLEDNPVVQDLLHNAPTPPPGVPEPLVRAIALPVLALRRRLIAWTVPDPLREAIGLAPVTRAEEGLLRGIGVVSRVAGRVLPERLRYVPMARKARLQALRGAASRNREACECVVDDVRSVSSSSSLTRG
jgi:uncharacterized protein (DUF2236 family)